MLLNVNNLMEVAEHFKRIFTEICLNMQYRLLKIANSKLSQRLRTKQNVIIQLRNKSYLICTVLYACKKDHLLSLCLERGDKGYKLYVIALC